MYYDRRLSDKLLETLLPGGALDWLAQPLHGIHLPLHVEFRRDRVNNKSGMIEVYLGRTALLAIRASTHDRFQFVADALYCDRNPEMFVGTRSIAELFGLRHQLEAHLLESAALLTGPRRAAFIKGEAIIHAGFMHRHGREYCVRDPAIGIDTEVVLGFPSAPVRDAFNSTLRTAVAIPSKESLPKKLDTLGVHRTGAIALVEIKDIAGDLARAVTQAAVHMYRFRHLLDLSPTHLVEVVDGHRRQKLQAGLLPIAAGEVAIRPAFVPIIAAPDARHGWADIWRSETASSRAANAPYLTGLRFWRLSEAGEILEEVAA